MNAMFTPRTNPYLCGILKVKLFLFLLLQLGSSIEAQQSNLPCNASTPFVNGTFSVNETHSSFGPACWEGDTLCMGGNGPGNVINTNTTDFATGNIMGVGSLVLRVSDSNTSNLYSGGNFAGFVVESGLLNAGAFGSITISTYLNGTLRESYDAVDLLTLNTDLFAGPFEIGFITSRTFNQIQIEIDDFLGNGSYNVYYAFMERYCAGPALQCNVQTAMNKPTYPMTIDYVNTGSSDVGVGNVDDPQDAVSASTMDYASLNNLAGVGSTFIAIQEQITNYPSGTFVGFDIQNPAIVSAEILNNLTITTYLNNVQQQQVTGGNLLIGAPLLSEDGRHIVGFVTNTPVDKVKLTVNQPVNVSLGTTRVYSAIFRAFCDGPDLICNTSSSPTLPAYPIFINDLNTGITGLLCAGCSVNNAHYVIDNDLSNYATIVITAGSANIGSLSVKDQLSNYQAGTFAGFHIENPSLVDVNSLEGITIVTYLDGVQQESETNSGALITIGTELLVNTGEQIVGFVTTEEFDEVTIRLANTVAVDIDSTRIYNLVLEEFCAATIVCDTTYYLNNPTFPVYIDAFLTGVDGAACVVCEVNDEQNVITADTSDFATITVAADVIGSASIAVADALYSYPQGTFAGFVIEDLGFLIEADLFESITISTYNNGTLQESMSGEDLSDLDLLFLFISADEGRYNVGFETSLPFDEIRITVGSLASAINQIRVYSAFVDTRVSYGGSLFCIAGPAALDDQADTDEDTPVDIHVLDNDTEGGAPIGPPIIVDNPDNGTVTVNADSTITYVPDTNFVGQDTFTYAICDDGPLCDTAMVVITVHPVIDTIEETIPADSTFTACLNDLTIFTSPATSISVCDGPSDGILVIDGACVSYDPNPGFTGADTFCVYTCHPDDPSLCDTTIIIITVIPQPMDDGPFAEPDLAGTNEDVTINIDVLANDSDPDSPLGIPLVIDPPSNGTASVNADSTILYTPDPDFVGVDSFTYAICDNVPPMLCDTALVIVTVNPVTDTIYETIPEDSSVTFCANDLTVFNETATFITVCMGPSNGTATISSECVTYVADANFTGQDTFCVLVCHPDIPTLCDTTIIIIIVTPVNDPPIAIDDESETDEEVPVTIDVLANDSDVDSPLGSPTIIENPTHGTVVINLDSTITYTPDLDFVGVDTFTYSICDNGAISLCDTAFVIITVFPLTDTTSESIPEDIPHEICASELTTFTGPAVALTICNPPSNGVITVTDTCLVYMPNRGFIGQDTICVFVCDPLFCDTTIVEMEIGQPLSVQWLSFKVEKLDQSAYLSWVTGKELNNDGFQIERSPDGQYFEKISELLPPGSLGEINSYSFIDHNPLEGMNYYRIMQKDLDGQIDYSQIRTINFGGNGFTFRVWPNPVTESLMIELSPREENVDISFISSSGKIIHHRKFEAGLTQAQFDMGSVSPGVYSLIIESLGQRDVEKIVVLP